MSSIQASSIKGIIQPELWQRAGEVIAGAIDASFRAHPMRHHTDDEVRRRFNLCVEILGVLVKDCHWSPQRAFDHLATYLLQHMNGQSWKPASGRVWLPGS